MGRKLLDLSPGHWNLLSILDACGEPVLPGLVADLIVPKPDNPDGLLRDLVNLGLVDRADDQTVAPNNALPQAVREALARINTPDHISVLIEKVQAKGYAQSLGDQVMVRLLTGAGNIDEAAEVELEIAHKHLKQGDVDGAYHFLNRAAGRLHHYIAEGGDDRNRLFVESVLELSSISFALGRGIKVLLSYLRTAVNLTEVSGNVRYHALTCLHLGRSLAYLDHVPEGLDMLAAGMEEVQSLGDTDILKSAAEFLGLYYSLKGGFKEALVHFERAEQHFIREENRILIYPMILWIMGVTLFASGQVPRALGFFHSYWRSARDMGMPAVASIARSLLGFSLAVARRRPEAGFHLEASLKDARENKNAYSLFIARTGMAILSFQEGDLESSFTWLQSAFEEGQKAPSAYTFINMYILDILASFHRNQLKPAFEGLEYEKQLERCLQNTGLHLRGIALRVRAEDKLRSGETASLVMDDLLASKEYLQRAGAALALNDTRIAIARLHLRESRFDEARLMTRVVSQQLREMGLDQGYLPEKLRRLLENESPDTADSHAVPAFADRYLEFLKELDASENEEELLHAAVRRFSQFLGAERGALFLANGRSNGHDFELKTGYNLTPREVDSEAFEPSLALIDRAIKENTFISLRPDPPPFPMIDETVKRQLCIAIQVGSEVTGVLYYDNLYLEVNFDFPPPQWAALLFKITNQYVRNLHELVRLREEMSRLAANKAIQLERLGSDQILAQSPAMLRVLDQADRAAKSEATLLITGESGTGKDLLASRIHTQSLRSSSPFVVLDSTTIPENLVESELFGHEKGAFTGADSRNIGRIELAHGGTLFIDEIGELPLQVQAKLLRAIETKSFYRVGGKQLVRSDFRLVAATNRRLYDEVADGRFRLDLYYRLNVIPLLLPPLKERGDDVILLARRFLKHYSDVYRRKSLKLSRRDEERLTSYAWPGNIRELKNVIERAVILARGNRITLDLPLAHESLEESALAETISLRDVERRYISRILEKTNGRIGGPDGAAALLGMKRSTLYSKMYKLGIK